MSILPIRSLHFFSIFQRSMIQASNLPLCEVLNSSLIAETFQEDKVSFGNADEDVFTPAITLWAMVSQFLFSGAGRT
jgi:putative transposase